MLPGFRFLLAAIVLSLSILVFGLGAAALLRAAHEQFASIPSLRVPPETVFAQANQPNLPVLAMLRVDPPAIAKASDNVPAAAEPVRQADIVSTPAESERPAALKPEEKPLAEIAKPEIAVPETQPQGQAASAQADRPAPTEETRIAAIEPIPQPSTEPAASQAKETAATVSEPARAAASVDADAASTKIATLGGPTAGIETEPPAKAETAKRSDRSAIRKRQQARRALQRRKLAARARLARQAPQQPADAFAQPTITVRNR